VDQKVQVTRPDKKGAVDIFKLYLKNVPLAHGVDVGEAADFAASLMYDNKFQFYNLFNTDGTKVNFTLAGLTNGAMIAGVVDKAAMQAMQRDIAAAQRKLHNDRGVTLEDIRVSIESTYHQNKHLNHEVEVKEFVENNQLSIDRIIKAQAA
jgi:SpoVK/Ycf46/Vps4 family AAA+-type ATPase